MRTTALQEPRAAPEDRAQAEPPVSPKPFRGYPYMPFRLKAVLVEHGITQPALAAAVKQRNGQPVSSAAINLLVNHRYFPRNVPELEIKTQVEAFLVDQGVPADEIATVWEQIGDDPLRNAHARGAHLDTPVQLRARARREAARGPEIEFDTVEVQMLSPAAKRHFKLFRDPFATEPEGPDDVFLGPDQSYALAAMEDAIRHNRLFALVGESGSGKTTLVDLLRDRIRSQPASYPFRIIAPVVPDKARLTEVDILVAILADLLPGRPIPARKERLSRLAKEQLALTVEEGRFNVLLFEEAHDLSLSAIKLLKRFHEFKGEWKKLLSIVLIGQPELMLKLGERGPMEAREVARRLEHVQLLPLDSELHGYVAHRLARGGVRADDLFAADAWPAVAERLRATVRDGTGNTARVSMCYPLLVHNLLTKCLNTAAELGAARVDAAIVKGA